MNKRVLVIDEKFEKDLTILCDIALKFAGMHMATLVADIANALSTKPSYPNFDDEEEW